MIANQFKLEVTRVVATHMERVYKVPALERGIPALIISYVDKFPDHKKIQLTAAQKVRNFFLTFFTLGIWDWIQSVRFERGVLEGSYKGLLKAISAIEWGADPYLTIDLANRLIEKGFQESFSFCLCQIKIKNIMNLLNRSQTHYPTSGYFFLMAASSEMKERVAQSVLSWMERTHHPSYNDCKRVWGAWYHERIDTRAWW